jgi:hypothetical protein
MKSSTDHCTDEGSALHGPVPLNSTTRGDQASAGEPFRGQFIFQAIIVAVEPTTIWAIQQKLPFFFFFLLKATFRA